MSELLAPAGNMDALRAAVANGADAVYLGLQKFGARAYSNNFDDEALAEAVAYAHLRGVKVYVTVNTIVFQDELPEVFAALHFLNGLGVDGVICQDLAVLTYIAEHFQDMEAHTSTQMGIDDLESTLLAKELGAKRVVISREVPLDQVKAIRQAADMPLEAFVHGALCVSYSGNCIMSGMTGNRSGNRGRCIGSCRKLYDVVEADSGKVLGQNYILSTKDLCTIDYADDLQGIDSLKIEGRMKEPVYVANVVSRYRMALDGQLTWEDKDKLTHTFNRTYTKGYLMGEDRRDITNVERPNNHGYEIGTICSAKKGRYGIQLTRPLKQNDVIRIRHDGQDVNLSVAKMYDAADLLINSSDDVCHIKLKERLSVGDVVYKTKDVAYTKELETRLTGEYRRFPLDFSVHAYPDAPLVVDGTCEGMAATFVSEDLLSEALNKPTTMEAVTKQLCRLNDTVFQLGQVDYADCGAFIPASLLNTARKEIVASLVQQRISAKARRERVTKPVPEPGAAASAAASAAPQQVDAGLEGGSPTLQSAAASATSPCTFEPQAPFLTASCATQEQADACREAGLNTVYFANVVARNNNANNNGYRDREGLLLVGGLGGIQRYRGTNTLVTDYSLNAVNAPTVALLHRLGAQRVTLSYEINQQQLADLLEAYRAENGSSPCLEMIVYGRAPLLVTKYCPLKKMDLCGTCRSKQYEIREEYGSFPVQPHADCTTTVLNGKVLNLLDEMPSLEGIQAFRLNFTTESAGEVRRIIQQAQGKLDGTLAEPVFNSKTDTRGYFNKEIL